MMPNRFPEELLDQPIQARYQYLNNLLVLHPHFLESRDAIWNALHDVKPGMPINVIGPAGVGKTVLLSWIKQQLLTEALSSLLNDLGRIPFVAIDALPLMTRVYNWNEFIIRSLLLLNEPLIEEKALSHLPYEGGRSLNLRSCLRENTIAPQLVRTLEQSLHYRVVSTFLVDDAQYLRVTFRNARLVEHFCNLLEMFQRTGTTFLSFGTYDLLDLMINMELAGWKSVNIHLQHYQINVSRDQLEFQNILLTFQQHVPVIIEPDFVQYLEYIYSGCAGCIGLLKSWLSRALMVVLEDGSGTITFKDLEKTKWPLSKLQKLVDEIERGGEALTRWNDEPHLRLIQSQGQKVKASKSSRRRIGQRNPVRDCVGE